MSDNSTRHCKRRQWLCDPCADLFAALSCPQRLRILRLLAEGRSRVGDLAGRMDIDVSVVSRHLRQLKNAGLVQSTRSGVNTYYAIEDPRVLDLVHTATTIQRERAMRMLDNE